MARWRRAWPLVVRATMAGAAGVSAEAGVAASVALPAIDGEQDASHCELYVESFGYGLTRQGQQEQKFLEVFLRVNERDLVDLQGEQVLAAGMAVAARSITAQDDDDGRAFLDVLEYGEVVTATRVAPGSYQLRFPFEERVSAQTSFKEVHGVSFFVVVKRTSGRVHRLWLRHGGAPYTLERVFSEAGAREIVQGHTVTRYPAAESSVYSERRACAPALSAR